MRVRISFDALRLCLLVAAGVTSGYLWRAAFESSSPDERLAGTPRIVEKAPAPGPVRIQPGQLTRPGLQAAHRAVERTGAGPVRQAPAGLISAPGAAAPQPTPKPTPIPTSTTPAPTPAPSPPPTTTTPPPPRTTTPAVSAPTQAAAAAPPATTTVAEDESRPGWGKGDENHDHSGPGSNKP